MTTVRPFRCSDMFHFSNVYVALLFISWIYLSLWKHGKNTTLSRNLVQPTCSTSLYEEVVTARLVLGNSTGLKGQFQGVSAKNVFFNPFVCSQSTYWEDYHLIVKLLFSENPTAANLRKEQENPLRHLFLLRLVRMTTSILVFHTND